MIDEKPSSHMIITLADVVGKIAELQAFCAVRDGKQCLCHGVSEMKDSLSGMIDWNTDIAGFWTVDVDRDQKAVFDLIYPAIKKACADLDEDPDGICIDVARRLVEDECERISL